MFRRILLIVCLFVALGIVFACVGLVLAHRQIDAIDPKIPGASESLRANTRGDLPVALSFINTASQPMPRGGVLEPSLDPDPEAPYVMSHASFVLEWSDGRSFLIDLGLDQEGADAFGGPLESFMGAAPIQFHHTVADALGADLANVKGLAFTHLHVDHTTGIGALCAAAGAPIPVFQTRNQVEELNYTTRGSDAQLASASCVQREILEGEGWIPIPGFPGLSVLPAGGHTPGTQVFLAHVKRPDAAGGVRSFVFTGDVVNHVDGLKHNLPKPALYSRFVVPESTERLERLRIFLAEIDATASAQALVSHDRGQIESTGLMQR